MNAEYLKQLLSYNQDTGDFFWLVKLSNRIKIGDVAGYVNTHDGYVYIKIDNKMRKAHRLAWLYMTGSFPEFNIDHINNIRSDNRFENLRSCTQSENMCNRGKTLKNTSGYKGVSLHSKTGKWRARIRKSGKTYSLGLYCTPPQAFGAYRQYCESIHKEFAHASD